MLDINGYLMKRTWYRIRFGLIKKIFLALLSNIANGPKNTKECHWAIKNV